MTLLGYEKLGLIVQIIFVFFSTATGYLSPDIQVGILMGYIGMIAGRKFEELRR